MAQHAAAIRTILGANGFNDLGRHFVAILPHEGRQTISFDFLALVS
jgi:hypothetical protein